MSVPHISSLHQFKNTSPPLLTIIRSKASLNNSSGVGSQDDNGDSQAKKYSADGYESAAVILRVHKVRGHPRGWLASGQDGCRCHEETTVLLFEPS